MKPSDSNRLKDYIKSLSEKEVWALLSDFFEEQQVIAHTLHSPGEHGMDVVAFVDQEKDILGIGYNILIQAKVGKLNSDKWRKDILYQLLETPYYEIRHSRYSEHVARRILLVVTDDATADVRESIKMFNQKHEITIELWELEDIIRRFDLTGFAKLMLEQISGVGQVADEGVMPPAVGE